MANRAYLYCCEDVSALTFKNHYEKDDGSERPYMDSRHQLPLAWFLFFEAGHIQLVPVPEGSWKDIYLVRPWAEARIAFEAQVPLLLEWFRGEFSQADIDEFLRRVQSLIETPKETWLVLDPNEIIEENAEPHLRQTFEEMQDSQLSDMVKLEALDRWAHVEPTYNLERRLEQRRDRVFGFYYGPPIPGYWLPRQPWPGEDGEKPPILPA